MSHTARGSIVLIATMMAVGVGRADTVAEIATGPDVGNSIPVFEAPDQHGKLRSFDDLRGPRGLLLLFHRTADW